MNIDKFLDKLPLKKLFRNSVYETAKREIKQMYNELVNDEMFRETHHMSSDYIPKNLQMDALKEVINDYVEIRSNLPTLTYHKKTPSYKAKSSSTILH